MLFPLFLGRRLCDGFFFTRCSDNVSKIVDSSEEFSFNDVSYLSRTFFISKEVALERSLEGLHEGGWA